MNPSVDRRKIITYISLMNEFTAERAGSVLTITIDNPSVGNALSRAAAIELADQLDALAVDADGVRAVLVRAEGRHFCTGADIRPGKSGATASSTTNGFMVRGLAASHHRVVHSMFTCPLPVVAAVNGGAFGFGLHLALAADFIVAGERATFAEPFLDRGFNVDSGGSWLLQRLVGLTRAKQMLYFGETVNAATALAWGLVADVVPDDELDAVARARADALAARPTQALAATKRLLHDNTIVHLGQAMHAESMAVELTIRSRDFKEGMKAFAEKRPPEFDGT
jgi:2-(1,2-epoxy-1,2-dihydrophenyl)acetyl-CoA isomerase